MSTATAARSKRASVPPATAITFDGPVRWTEKGGRYLGIPPHGDFEASRRTRSRGLDDHDLLTLGVQTNRVRFT